MSEKNKQNIGLVVSLLIVGFLFCYGLFFSTRGPAMMGQTGQWARLGTGVDQHFIEQMIPHHEGAISMAEIALEKSKRPEIISLAKGIIDAQTKEINDMKEWYQEWFDVSVPATSQGMMGGGGMGHMDSMSGDLDALKNASDFDLEFIRQMIPHHEMAVMMAQMLENNTSRAEMKELADNIITSQNREIKMMRSWSKDWSTSQN